jgi:hypothetical protein
MPSQPSHGGHQKVGASRPRCSTSFTGYIPWQEEDGAFDDEVDPPPVDARHRSPHASGDHVPGTS